ncbi:NADH-quinone oxidoreductase subunit 5 family protein [Pseudochryseolinea flava]|uniref:NADH-quinone oxidoreductase subunit L n=1 Tax=Pseudochryseolinea flava TaxID=2059302 RepID=A0A364Y212_9BACT|nr:NADH-quinone oxidoreductase subunit L [Pseudochryseolinea flava]RAV99815.1 NADH-quinone oxidoreductase subunit L [Pseudochryseolinea flava]
MEAMTQHTVLFCLGTSLSLPLLSAMLSLVVRERYAWIVSVTSPFLMFVAAVTAVFVSVSTWNEPSLQFNCAWFQLGEIGVRAGVLLNNHTRIMLIVVTTVSALVHIYSTGYMAGDHGLRKYFSALGFFTFAMLLLCVADNFMLIFFAWELVGFSSYLLIGHWSEKPEAAAAAKKAFIFNRFGDAGFLIGMLLIAISRNTFDINALSLVQSHNILDTAAALCIFCGVIGKSAQFPLLTWLPDAMEGPTPVSALIHAATMVAAGIFLIVRVHFIFTPEALNVVVVFGALTALMAALSACVQHDLKKILAYSTISQLGLMVTAAGVGDPSAAMLHLFTHAFFKACLFLGAGSIIHAVHHAQSKSLTHFDVQDVRNLGGLRRDMPFTAIAFLIAGASLAGLPFFSGFLSKDAILSAVFNWTNGGTWQYLILINTLIVSMLTVIYMFRLFWNVFMGEFRGAAELDIHEAPMVMRGPIAVLMICSIWLIVSFSPIHFDGWLYSGLNTTAPHNTIIVIVSALWVLLSLLLAYSFRNKTLQSEFLFRSFYLDRVYSATIIKGTSYLSQLTTKTDVRWIDGGIHLLAYVQVTVANLIGWFDRFIVDGIVNLFAWLANGIGAFIRSFQEGKIQLYVFWSSIAIVIFLIWTLF